MIYPPISKLLAKVDSRYTLVILAAKRAREIADIQMHNPEMFSKKGKHHSDKPVTIAIDEIAEGRITFTRRSDLKERNS